METFLRNERVQLHPACDAWMAGDRYGTVVKAGRKYVTVQMDRSGKRRRVPYDLLLHTGETYVEPV